MTVFATVYAFMASILPKSGASYEWPREFLHPFVGFFVAWLRILGSVGALVTLSLVLVQYLSLPLRLPTKSTMFLLLLGVFLLNVRGIQISARAQTIAMCSLILALGVFVALGVPHIKLANIGNPLSYGNRILAAVPLLIPLFLGSETATEVGEEVRNARRVIPKALALAMLLTVSVYLAVSFTAFGLLGSAQLARSSAPLLEAARLSLDELAAPLILTATTLAVLKSLNSIFVVFSRYLYAMARAGVLPSPIARVHETWGTPHIAILVAFVAAVVGLALPKDLIFLFVAISIPTVLKYMSTCASSLALIRTRPDLANQSGLRLSHAMINGLASLGILCALFILLIGFQDDWRPYALVAAWGSLGIVYWFARGSSAAKPALSPEKTSKSLTRSNPNVSEE